ncbi:50S ribosomal protein L21 [candidate division WWE3 bacterium]|nr:50S ribosomal protein L21 [candidate division WWE3 bacterium]
MYAVIETGSKQYMVTPGMKLFVEKLDAQAGETVVFDKIALLVNDSEVQIGSPYVKTTIEAEVVSQIKDPKKSGLRYEGGSYRRRFGHRQPKTVVMIKEFTNKPKKALKGEEQA